MPVEWSGLAPELLLALDRRTRRRSLILHPSLAGGSGAGTHPRDGAIRPLSLHAGSVTAEGAVLLDYRLG